MVEAEAQAKRIADEQEAVRLAAEAEAEAEAGVDEEEAAVITEAVDDAETTSI